MLLELLELLLLLLVQLLLLRLLLLLLYSTARYYYRYDDDDDEDDDDMGGPSRPAALPRPGFIIGFGVEKSLGVGDLEGFMLQMRPVQWGLEFEVGASTCGLNALCCFAVDVFGSERHVEIVEGLGVSRLGSA